MIVFLTNNVVRRGRHTNGSMRIIFDEAGVRFVCLYLLLRHYCTLSRILLDTSALVFMLQHFWIDQLSSDDSTHGYASSIVKKNSSGYLWCWHILEAKHCTSDRHFDVKVHRKVRDVTGWEFASSQQLYQTAWNIDFRHLSYIENGGKQAGRTQKTELVMDNPHKVVRVYVVPWSNHRRQWWQSTISRWNLPSKNMWTNAIIHKIRSYEIP
jgi:hypothetical protein